MTADGFLRTGDVAYMDQDGFVFIVDRIKDMLLCGGFNVYPRNIEEAIYQHPSVEEVSVIAGAVTILDRVTLSLAGRLPSASETAAVAAKGLDVQIDALPVVGIRLVSTLSGP